MNEKLKLMINPLYFLILTVVVFTSCNQEKINIAYFKNGKVSSITNYNEVDSFNYSVVFFYENGSVKCFGSRKNGEKDGKWIYVNTNGIVRENYKNGLLNDTIAYYYLNGIVERYKILDKPIPCFCDSNVNVGFKQIAFFANGNLKEINHIMNCKFNGKTQIFDSLTGDLLQEYFETDGIVNGAYKQYFENNTIRYGYYKNNEPVGRWTTYQGDSLISEKIY